jgi:murein DD-endopeptidase MepM/ murein hydrolase activator NlpD
MWTHQDDTKRRLVAALVVVPLLGAACGPTLTPLPPAVAPAPSEILAPAPVAETAAPNVLTMLRARRLMVPVDGITIGKLSDSYEAQRDGGVRRHGAIDIMAPRGTPVLAADDGKVLRMGHNSLGGLTVYQVDPDQRFVYYYAHLDRYSSTLRDGMSINRGDVIGYVGSSGNASPTAPHLHFQVMVFRERYWEGESVNPFGSFELDGKRR